MWLCWDARESEQSDSKWDIDEAYMEQCVLNDMWRGFDHEVVFCV